MTTKHGCSTLHVVEFMGKEATNCFVYIDVISQNVVYFIFTFHKGADLERYCALWWMTCQLGNTKLLK